MVFSAGSIAHCPLAGLVAAGRSWRLERSIFNASKHKIWILSIAKPPQTRFVSCSVHGNAVSFQLISFFIPQCHSLAPQVLAENGVLLRWQWTQFLNHQIPLASFFRFACHLSHIMFSHNFDGPRRCPFHRPPPRPYSRAARLTSLPFPPDHP